MPTKTIAARAKAVAVSKFIEKHRDYCAQFERVGDGYFKPCDETYTHYTQEEYDQLIHNNLMYMAARCITVANKGA